MFGVRETVYSLFLCQAIKKKIQTIVNANRCIQRVPNLGNKRRYIHKKPHQESGPCNLFHMQDMRKNVLRKFIKLCMEAPCWFPFEGHKYGYWKSTETFVFEFCYKCMNLSLWEVRKIKVIFILRQGMFR